MGFKGRKPLFYLTSPFSMVYLRVFNLFNGEKAMPEPILTENDGVKYWQLNSKLYKSAVLFTTDKKSALFGNYSAMLKIANEKFLNLSVSIVGFED